jgi:hypothetical protein
MSLSVQSYTSWSLSDLLVFTFLCFVHAHLGLTLVAAVQAYVNACHTHHAQCIPVGSQFAELDEVHVTNCSASPNPLL